MSVKAGLNRSRGPNSLQACLIEGDRGQCAHERRIRGRALAVSIVLQCAIVLSLILIPLFSRPGRIAFANVVPVPPYSAHEARNQAARERVRAHSSADISKFQPTKIPPNVAKRDAEPPGEAPEPPGLVGDTPVADGQIPLADSRARMELPPPPPPQSRIIHQAHIDAAMLIHRVEPGYPTLARQIGRSGRVELHAIIATDGSITSLQVVSGDPMFYSSALDAVRQWRYTPTVLNGQAVEVDTYITVIYNITR